MINRAEAKNWRPYLYPFLSNDRDTAAAVAQLFRADQDAELSKSGKIKIQAQHVADLCNWQRKRYETLSYIMYIIIYN